MSDVLVVYVWPFAAAVLAYILCVYVISKRRSVFDYGRSRLCQAIASHLQGNRGEKDLSLILILVAMMLLGQELLILIIENAVRRLANTYLIEGAPVSPVIYAVFAFMSDACVVGLILGKDTRLKTACKTAAAALPVILILETVLFNAGSFSADQKYYAADLSQASYEISDDLTVPHRSGEGIVLEGDAAILISDLPDYTRAVNIGFARDEVRYPLGVFVQFKVLDDNTGASFSVADVKPVSGYNDVSMFMRPYGDLKRSEILVTGVTDPVTITGVTAFNTSPYRANAARFVVMAVIFSAAVFICAFRLWKVYFDERKKSHVIALALCILLTIGTTFLVYKTDEFELIEYPFYHTWEVDDIFALKFDAMKKGLPYLDLPSEEGLDEMDNIYDFTERSAANVYYRWDYAYRDGHYYCYFGAAPVLLFYFPFWFITRCVPSYNLALSLAGTLAATGIIFGYLATAQRYIRRKKLLPYLLSIPVVCISSHMFYEMLYPMQYYLPALCALAFLGFAVFLGFTAVSAKKDKTAVVLYALSGLSLALCAGSRPVTAMGAAVLLPAFMRVLTGKKYTVGNKAVKASAFALPVIAGIIMMLAYNNFRFGSPFDFGENYQLTISNISSLKVDIKLLPASVFYYFFQPYSMSQTFPFFKMIAYPIDNYEVFRNIELNAGIMNIPFFLAGLLLMWGTLTFARKGHPGRAARIEFSAYALITLFITFVIAWFDFCRGGTAVRYTADFAFILAMMTGVVFMRTLSMPSGRKTLYGIIMAALIVTPVLIFLSYLPLYNSNLHFIYPDIVEKTEDFFLFWR